MTRLWLRITRFFRRLLWVGPTLALLGIGGEQAYWYWQPDDPRVVGGVPRIDPWQGVASGLRVLAQPGFLVGYSERYGQPLWVGWQARADWQHSVGPRPGDFTVDGRTLARVAPEQYRGSGYDRGHLAPNYALARLHGPESQLATFRMSNITPQRPELNQQVWQRLEQLEMDVVLPRVRQLWVLTGPVLAPPHRWLDGQVAVPKAFWRIWLIDTPEGPQSVAFLVPQEVGGEEPLDHFLVSVDTIEAATGLDLFARHDRALQAQFEGLAVKPQWINEKHWRRRGRYARE